MAEFITYVTDTGNKEDFVELRYEDDNLWLTQKKMAALYGVTPAEINRYVEEVYGDSQLKPELTVKKYMTSQNGASGEECGEDHYSLQMILAVGSKINNEKAITFSKWVNDIAGDYKIKGFGGTHKKKKVVFLVLIVIAALLLGILIFGEIIIHTGVDVMKPVIYLYPEEEMQTEVKLDYSGKLTCTYPFYDDGWKVTAHPDGILTDAAGQTYNYLYWEGSGDEKYDFSQGFCVPGDETAAFLENALEKLGLNRREANEFIVYWLPLMQKNPYNVISFQTDVYTQAAKLHIEPAPDTLIRVFMAWKPADCFVDIPQQTLEGEERTGFTVVEWGGAEIRN